MRCLIHNCSHVRRRRDERVTDSCSDLFTHLLMSCVYALRLRPFPKDHTGETSSHLALRASHGLAASRTQIGNGSEQVLCFSLLFIWQRQKAPTNQISVGVSMTPRHVCPGSSPRTSSHTASLESVSEIQPVSLTPAACGTHHLLPGERYRMNLKHRFSFRISSQYDIIT